MMDSAKWANCEVMFKKKLTTKPSFQMWSHMRLQQYLAGAQQYSTMFLRYSVEQCQPNGVPQLFLDVFLPQPLQVRQQVSLCISTGWVDLTVDQFTLVTSSVSKCCPNLQPRPQLRTHRWCLTKRWNRRSEANLGEVMASPGSRSEDHNFAQHESRQRWQKLWS